MTTPWPDYDDVMNECRAIGRDAPQWATFSTVGKSEEGRDLPLLTLTDPATSAAHKSVFLLTGGTDGNEEVGRAIVLAMARSLLQPEHRRHLERQVVLMVPDTNPDGCVRDQPGNANGVRGGQVHAQGKPPATAEGRAMRALVEQWIPDAHVDYHGLAGGGMGDTAFLYPTVNDKWSVPVLLDVMRELDRAGGAAGYPHDSWPRTWRHTRDNLPGWLARNYSTFCMVLECTENYYPIEESQQAGVVRLLRLMELGEEVRWFQDHPNYPCDIVSGNRMGAVLPYGEDYAARRRSRRDISQMILQGVPHLGREPCDRDWTAVIAFPVEDPVTTFPQGMTFKATIDRRATVDKVLWQDHVLERGLWRVEMTSAGVVVTADVPEAPRRGENRLSITYRVPFKRHVEPRREGTS
jgi:hypothetical protein